nr:lipopolysaccharide biosynthesis protein [Spirosomataceae bacterium]
MDTVKKQVFLSTVFSYAGVIVGAISQWFIVPNVLSKAENGLLAVLLSYMYILIQLSNLGFNSAGGRFFPSFYNPKKGHNGYLFSGIFISSIGFLICLIGLYFYRNNVLVGNSFLKQIEILQPLFKTENSEKSALFIKYFYLLVPITLGQLLFNIFDNYAKNLYDTATGTFLSQFFQRFWLLISFIVLALNWVDFEGFIWIWTLAFIIPTILMIYRSIRLGGFSLKPDFSIFTAEFRKPFVNYSALTVLTGFSTMII